MFFRRQIGSVFQVHQNSPSPGRARPFPERDSAGCLRPGCQSVSNHLGGSTIGWNLERGSIKMRCSVSTPLRRGLKARRGGDQYLARDPSSNNGRYERMDRRKKIQDR